MFQSLPTLMNLSGVIDPDQTSWWLINWANWKLISTYVLSNPTSSVWVFSTRIWTNEWTREWMKKRTTKLFTMRFKRFFLTVSLKISALKLSEQQKVEGKSFCCQMWADVWWQHFKIRRSLSGKCSLQSMWLKMTDATSRTPEKLLMHDKYQPDIWKLY